jgi:MoaA/NifB/PqqE/SkfB family radical SAM enzyme
VAGTFAALPEGFFRAGFPKWKLCNYRSGPSAEFVVGLKAVEAALLRKSEVIPPIPVALNLEFSYECNLSCIMCRQAERRRRNAGQLGSTIMRDVFNHHVEIGEVAITGVEPFYGEPARLFLCQCAERRPHFVLALITNGMLMDFDLLARLNVGSIHLSVSGDTKATYEAVHRDASWEMAMGTLQRLSALRRSAGGPPTVGTNFVVFSFNIHELPGAVRRDVGLGIETLASFGVAPPLHPEWDIRRGPRQAVIRCLREALGAARFAATRHSVGGILKMMEAAAHD